MKKLTIVLVNLLLLGLFLLLGFMVKDSAKGILFDIGILEFLHRDQNPLVFAFMKFISFIGSELFLFPAIGLLLLVKLINKSYYSFKLLIFNSLGSYLLNLGLKLSFNRTRPLEFILVKQGGLSYPSGHSMVSLSFYLTLAYLINKNCYQRYRGKLPYSIALLISFIMGLSRLYLGVHWPTDIIGGYIGGYLVHWLSIKLIKEKKFFA